MIKVDKKKVELKGCISILLTELTGACSAIKEIIIEDGKSEEEAKKILQKCFDLAFMSEEEVELKTNELLLKLLLKGLKN